MSKPLIAGYRSIKLEMEPGDYLWCACGKSQNQPFCDFSHIDGEIEPLMVSIPEKRLVKWCACKQTKNPPFCDHSHRELDGYEAK